MWRGSPSWAFGLGLIAGGVASALALLVVGALVRLVAPPFAWWGLVGIALLVIAVREVGWVSFALPQNARLVPESVFRHGRFFGPFEFGLEMGTGVRTYVTSGLPYVLALAVLLLAGPAAAVAAGVGFGLGRTLMTFSNLGFDTDGGWDFEFASRGPLIRVLLLSAFAGSLLAYGAAVLSTFGVG